MKPAGIRIDPPPSPAVASVKSPPATPAALPPEDPPGVRDSSHGFFVAPFSTVRVRLTPPNSLAVVRPNATAPPRSVMRATGMLVFVAMRSINGIDASVSGQPRTESSSFTPIGIPPKGSEMSADAARSIAPSVSTKETALSPLALIAFSVACISSFGCLRPARYSSTSEHASPCHGESVMKAS
ncbi:unannotated protein [freshwater metagenome]|uniref:Unannotated protein n=1 Tax=freshwater metagenome TaxID=449393 RepID=A0A6J6HYH9_9ZZZZ